MWRLIYSKIKCMNDKIWNKFKPEFLIIPYSLYEDRSLRPTDRVLYGVIYYFGRMKKGKCIASNKRLKEFCNVSTVRAVQAGLARLEGRWYIERVFKSSGKRNRVEIICKIVFHWKKNEQAWTYLSEQINAI